MHNKKTATNILKMLPIDKTSHSVILEHDKDKISMRKNICKKNYLYKNVISISHIFLNEIYVNNNEELLQAISDPEIRVIKLNCNIDLSKSNDRDVHMRLNDIIIDGQNHEILVPPVDRNLDNKFLTFEGENILLKNINFKVQDNHSKLSGAQCNAISIKGNNIRLNNIRINQIESTGLSIQGTDIVLDGISIIGNKMKNTAIRINNGKATIKNINIHNSKGIGIEILGKNSIVNIEENLNINSGIDVKVQERSGGKVYYNEGQLLKINRVFGNDFYKVVSGIEKVQDEKEFLEYIKNPRIEKLILEKNLDFRGIYGLQEIIESSGIELKLNGYYIILSSKEKIVI